MLCVLSILAKCLYLLMILYRRVVEDNAQGVAKKYFRRAVRYIFPFDRRKINTL